MKYLQKSRFNQLAEEMNAKVQQYRAEYSRDKMKEYLAEKRQTLSEAMEQMQKLEKERKERFAALGFDARSDKMPDLKELLERFDQMTKPQLPTNWLMRLTTKRYLRAYPHLQGTHHASLKKEEKIKDCLERTVPEKRPCMQKRVRLFYFLVLLSYLKKS